MDTTPSGGRGRPEAQPRGLRRARRRDRARGRPGHRRPARAGPPDAHRLLANGHALLEGVPGLGKTMLVRTIADVIDCAFNRIQFTPDLMPADITGTNILVEEDGRRVFRFQPGPIFANLVLADEINRATPKTQSALLEAMQEHQVTVARNRYPLDPPFFVLATQNPLEMEGTYPLPEAQLDRFLFKVMVPFPSEEDLIAIIDRTTGADAPTASKVCHRGRDRRDAAARPRRADRAARDGLRRGPARATHPDQPRAPELVREYVRYGGSPRGAQALVAAGKIRALLDGRFNVSIDDIRAVALPALRHRVILNFEGEAEGITTDAIVRPILDGVARPVRRVGAREPATRLDQTPVATWTASRARRRPARSPAAEPGARGRARPAFLPSEVDPTVFDEGFLRQLERLCVLMKPPVRGGLKGGRRSVKRGQSVEFADYRDYTLGDDLRQLDWNVYARLEKLFVKLFIEEEDVTVHFLLDASASMASGQPTSCCSPSARRRPSGTSPSPPRTASCRVARRAAGAAAGALRGSGRVFRLLADLSAIQPRRGPDRPRGGRPARRRAGHRPGRDRPGLRPPGPGRRARHPRARGDRLGADRPPRPLAPTSWTRRSRATCGWSTPRPARGSTSPWTSRRWTATGRAWRRGRRASPTSPRGAGRVRAALHRRRRWPTSCSPSCGAAGSSGRPPMSFAAPLALPACVPAARRRVLHAQAPARRGGRASTLLWQRLVADVEANAPWQRLRRSLLLLLQLLLVLLLALLAARPFVERPAGLARDLVLVIDTSASMAATDVGAVPPGRPPSGWRSTRCATCRRAAG